jgi:VanZ family protein
MSAKRKLRYNIISIVILVIWLGFIFGMSAKNGEESAGISYRIAIKIYKLYGVKSLITFNNFHTLIRKLAHFTEYGILALLIVNFLKSFQMLYVEIQAAKFKMVGIISILSCAIYAAMDEYHQSFVAGRGPSVRDVVIDTCGAITFFIVYVVYKTRIKSR